MDCPACRRPLVVVEREQIELDWCLDCRGLWFDEGELGLLAEKTGRRLEGGDFGRLTRPDAEPRRRCPRCGRWMEPAVVGKARPVRVDRCADHGVWLDRGELGRIVRQLASSDASDEAVIVEFLGETFSAVREEAPQGEVRE